MYKKYAQLLDNAHKTTYQVSKDTGIPQGTFSQWKSGLISKPGIDKLYTLAKYFNVPIEYFLEDSAEEESG